MPSTVCLSSVYLPLKSVTVELILSAFWLTSDTDPLTLSIPFSVSSTLLVMLSNSTLRVALLVIIDSLVYSFISSTTSSKLSSISNCEGVH